jgi:hypothetical protein
MPQKPCVSWQAAQFRKGRVRFSRFWFEHTFWQKKNRAVVRRGLSRRSGGMDQPMLRVRMKPRGPKGAGITALRTRDWLSGALEFQAICTKLGFEKMNSIGL